MMIKKFSFLLLSVFLIAGTLFAQSEAVKSLEKITEDGIKIKYPSDWKFESRTSNEKLIHRMQTNGVDLIEFSLLPKENASSLKEFASNTSDNLFENDITFTTMMLYDTYGLISRERELLGEKREGFSEIGKMSSFYGGGKYDFVAEYYQIELNDKILQIVIRQNMKLEKINDLVSSIINRIEIVE